VILRTGRFKASIRLESAGIARANGAEAAREWEAAKARFEAALLG
jgi:hypothetical protein